MMTIGLLLMGAGAGTLAWFRFGFAERKDAASRQQFVLRINEAAIVTPKPEDLDALIEELLSSPRIPSQRDRRNR